MTLTDMVQKGLEGIDGWDDLDEKQKGICICFASIQIAHAMFKWISEHQEEIKSWVK